MNRRQQEQQNARRTKAADWAKSQTSFGATAFKLPEGAKFFKPVPDSVLIDIIPYYVGKGNPRADEGMQHFEREFYTHRIPVMGGVRSYCCLENWGDECPVCKFINAGAGGDAALAKSLKPSTRHLWNVMDRNGKRPSDIMIWETNHYNRGLGFGEQLVALVNRNVRDFGDFASLEDGFSLELQVVDTSFPGGRYNAITRVDFVKRESPLPSNLLEKSYCLDELLIKKTPDELLRLLHQGDTGESPEDQDDINVQAREAFSPPAQSSHRAQEKEEENPGWKKGDMCLYAGNEYEITRISADGLSATLQSENGEKHPGISTDDLGPVKAHGAPDGRKHKEEEDSVKDEWEAENGTEKPQPRRTRK